MLADSARPIPNRVVIFMTLLLQYCWYSPGESRDCSSCARPFHRVERARSVTKVGTVRNGRDASLGSVPRLPDRDHPPLARARPERAIDADARDPGEPSTAVDHGQPLALPGRDARLLQQVLQAAARTAGIGLQVLAAAAQPDRHRARAQPRETDAGAARGRQAQRAAEALQYNP